MGGRNRRAGTWSNSGSSRRNRASRLSGFCCRSHGVVGIQSSRRAKGKDGGVDVLAFPDVFGLASPRIKVQVKNQKSSARHVEVGYLNGVLGSGERGLFVCTGGFTSDAKNASFIRDGKVSLVDGHQLLDLLLEHYEDIPPRAKALLPLRHIYLPERPILD